MTSGDVAWSANFDQPWAAVNSTGGVLAGSAAIVLVLDIDSVYLAALGEQTLAGTLTVSDLSDPMSTMDLQLSVTVIIADSAGVLELIPVTTVTAMGDVGGPITVIGGTIELTSAGGGLNWYAHSSSPWLTLSQTSGRIEAGETHQVELILGLDEEGLAINLPQGDYSAQACFVNLSDTGGDVAIPVSLKIGAGSTTTGLTYYVDFESGSDGHDGRSPNAPWKHCPGDPNALIVPAGTFLAPGDRVVFKGGVHYRGSIKSQSSGTPVASIVYDGNSRNSFGVGRAVIDGSQVLTNWTQVSQTVYSAALPNGVDPFSANLFEFGRRLILAQGPITPSNPLQYDNTDEYRSVGPANVGPGHLTDPAYFSTLPQGFHENSFIAILAPPNVVYLKPVTGYDAGSGTIAFQSLQSIYTGSDTKYALINSAAVLDEPGEYYIDPVSNSVILWPHDSASLDTLGVTVSVRGCGIDLAGEDYQTVVGFRIIKHSAGVQGWNSGVGVRSTNSIIYGASIRDNEIAFNRSMEKAGALTLFNAINCDVLGNMIYRNMQNRGTLFDDCQLLEVSRNTLFANGGTGITAYTCLDTDIARNVVLNHRGVHANGITLYVDSQNCVIRQNVVYGGNYAATIQNSSDVSIEHNTFSVAPGLDVYTVADWGGCDNLHYYNNVIMSDLNKGLLVGATSSVGAKVRNNIIDGGLYDPAVVETTHNIYTSLSWMQSVQTLGVQESFIPDKGVVFEFPDTIKFGLAAGSPAIDAGVDLGLAPPVYGAEVDIGAIEFRP